MLELRPNCELCDRDLPPNSLDARICSYECTFCADCADSTLLNVCPNCGGGLTPRPVRPTRACREGISLAQQPASQLRVRTRYSLDEIAEFCDKLKDIPPAER